MRSNRPGIKIRNLSFSYQNARKALDNINLEVGTSNRLILAGPNGCGKSTLLLHLNGLLDGSGEISIAGLERTRGNMAAIRKRIGYLFSQVEYQFIMPDLLNDIMLSVPEEISEISRRKEIAMGWLEQLGLAEYAGRSPLELSSGEMKRAALAGILAREPKVILMDEPLNNLDRESSMQLLDILSALEQTMVIATHRRLVAEECATHVAFMKKGRIEKMMGASEALADPLAGQVFF
ncbi:MAG: ATP-binding cassette domain-containing protein [Candidatus Latescibacteria bacterium]|nr:ATP-binding cassette domain-containing protein [Candidatus Latescibacterota bacterium]